MAALDPLEILPILRSHEYGYRKVAFSRLISSMDPSGDLKVRKVFKERLMANVKKVQGGWMANQVFTVRATGDPMDSKTKFTIFDGTHRYHGVDYIIHVLKDLKIFSMEWDAPCLIYKKSLPDDTAMTFATLVNEMQKLSSSGTTLDFMRFLANLRKRQAKTDSEGALANNIYAAMNSMFRHMGEEAPAKANISYIKSAIKFLKLIGEAGFAEAERLQDHVGAGVFQYVKRLTDTEERPELKDDAVLTSVQKFGSSKTGGKKSPCFLPDSTWIFEVSLAKLVTGKAQVGTSGFNPINMYLRALWAYWIITGGKTCSKEQAKGIIKRLVDDMKNWVKVDVGPSMKIHMTACTWWNTLPVDRKLQIMDSVDENKLEPIDWEKQKGAEGILCLKLTVPQAEMVRLIVMHGEEELPAEKVNENVLRELPFPGTYPSLQILFHDIKVLHKLAAQLALHMPLDQELAPENMELSLENAKESFIAAVEVILCSELNVVMTPTGDTSQIKNVPSIKTKVVNNWFKFYQEEMKELGDKPEVLRTGETFHHCRTDIKDAIEKQNILQAQVNAHKNKQKMIEVNRMLQKKEAEEAERTRLAARTVERQHAKVDELVLWNARWDKMHKKDQEVRAKDTEEHYRIIEMPKSWTSQHAGWKGEAGKAKANKSWLLDLANLVLNVKDSLLSGDDLLTYLDRMLLNLSTLGFEGVISVVCVEWQQKEVYTSLLKSTYDQLDPSPYIIGHTRTAFTLEDKYGVMSGDDWGMSRNLSEKTKQQFGHGHPECQIISAMTKGAPAFKDQESWNGGEAAFLRHFSENNPQHKTFHADKFHFSVNTSKDWTSGYPWAHAFANFLYWRTVPATTVGYITHDAEDNLLPVVTAVMRRKTLVICTPKEKPVIAKALLTAYYISDPENAAYWTGYQKDLTFLLHVEFALGAAAHATMDAFQLLMSQTASEDDRYSRGTNFFCKAWKGLKILPKKVSVPEKPGTHMLGCIAESDLSKGETIVRGTGHWWHKAYALPTAIKRGYTCLNGRNVPKIWGMHMDMQTSPNDVPENLLFVLNASSVMSCFNDFRGIANEQNAELATEFYLDDEARARPCLSIAVVASRDIKQGEQVLVNYGSKFWNAKEDVEENENDRVIFFCSSFFYLSRFTPHMCNVGRA